MVSFNFNYDTCSTHTPAFHIEVESHELYHYVDSFILIYNCFSYLQLPQYISHHRNANCKERDDSPVSQTTPGSQLGSYTYIHLQHQCKYRRLNTVHYCIHQYLQKWFYISEKKSAKRIENKHKSRAPEYWLSAGLR